MGARFSRSGAGAPVAAVLPGRPMGIKSGAGGAPRLGLGGGFCYSAAVTAEGTTPDPAALREEDRRVRQLQFVVSLALQTIAQDSVTYGEAMAVLDGTRTLALNFFPGKELAFDLIYRPRFQRLIAQRFRLN